jgi:hypothetical protein
VTSEDGRLKHEEHEEHAEEQAEREELEETGRFQSRKNCWERERTASS